MLRFGVAVDSPSPRETDASPNAAGGCRQAALGIQPRPVSRLVVGSASQGYVIYPCRGITKSPQPVIPVIQQRPLCRPDHRDKAVGQDAAHRGAGLEIFKLHALLLFPVHIRKPDALPEGSTS